MPLMLDDIRYFPIIAEQQNVTRAAEVIGISQPALSYSIKRLEQELGSQLFIRLKTGIKLSKVGEEFYKRSKLLIQNWESAQNILSEDSKDITGEFSFGAHPSVALSSTHKMLKEVFKKFPRLKVSLHYGLSREITNKVIN